MRPTHSPTDNSLKYRLKLRSFIALLATTTLFTVASTLILPQPKANAYPNANVDFTGHGWGHGIGMGQWGSLGYALGQDGGLGNWTYQEILTHYYGGTSIQTIPSPEPNVSVALLENNDNDVIVTAPGGVSVPGVTGTNSSAPAVLFAPSGNGSTWIVQTGAGCAGPTWTTVATGLTNPTTQAASNSTNTSAGDVIQLCLGGGNMSVQGSLGATYNSAGALRTVNTLPLEEYVADVAPAESPSDWAFYGGPGPQGMDWGFQQSEAQTVAARSYVESNPLGYGGYADICDTTACQEYQGVKYETPTSIQAAADTAGQVMEFGTKPGGTIATTEYSASTGGYTAGGPFPSVPDAGDSICIPNGPCNPNHTWTATVPVTTIESTWPQIGTLESINVTARNGYGQWGGRATEVSVVGSSTTLTLTGAQFAGSIGLNSDWFIVTAQASGGVGGYWEVASDGGIFSFGDAHFYGSMGGIPLNKPVVGMAVTPDGGGYWEVASDGGIFSF